MAGSAHYQSFFADSENNVYFCKIKNKTMSQWKKIQIERENGEIVEAQAPVIVSASRSTDIPAFYADWFFHRLKVGYSAF